MSSHPAPQAPVRFAFSTAEDGDLRDNRDNRERFARRVGAPVRWAELRQVHGSAVVEARGPGHLGEGDALYTRQLGVALAVFVADCVGLVVTADSGVGVAHAGWRGALAGVAASLVETMTAAGLKPLSAHMSPSIGACCFEVGPEVAVQFPHATSTTNSGRVSVDLWKAIAAQLSVPLEPGPGCTYHDESYLSHRKMSAEVGADNVGRMVALAWREAK
ncbi:MAG TPA: polyphenol oxidase family protein [Acidimicrobiia bacterium]|nr:polyphenol oxidase family protein [Acidimicrobiia bacterium]